MKKSLFGLLIALGVLISAPSGFAAPTAPTFSTLSAAVAASTSTTTLTLVSTTGMTLPTQAGISAYILIDGEMMRLRTVVSSTQLTVSRGGAATQVSTHASGAYAVYGIVTGTSWDPYQTGSPTFGTFLARGVRPTGSCTLSVQQYSPVFETVDLGGNPTPYADACVGGQWSRGNWPAVVLPTAARNICTYPLMNPGAIISDLTAYGTDATRVAGTIYVGSVDVPTTRVITLLSNLTGTTAPTTDKQLFAIYDSASGTTAAAPIAWTALAGVAAATADIFFDQNLTTPVILVPGRYFFALQVNGTTTSIQMIPTAGGYSAIVGNSRTGVFGTLGNITIPTSLTTSAAPIMCGA